MKTLLNVLIGLPALLFIVMGLRWAIDPSGAANFAGMPLLNGLGLSSQIGDLGATFLSMGIMMLLGVFTQHRSWLYPPAMVLFIVACFRLLAWSVHGAPFATTEIAIELVVGSLLLITVKQTKTSS